MQDKQYLEFRHKVSLHQLLPLHRMKGTVIEQIPSLHLRIVHHRFKINLQRLNLHTQITLVAPHTAQLLHLQTHPKFQ